MHPDSPPDPRNPAPHAPVTGVLQGEVWLVLQSWQAQSLVHGRPAAQDKSAITGLTGFADRLKGLWQAVRTDDPWADWWLVRIEDAIDEHRDRLQQVLEDLQRFRASLDGLEFDFAQSSRPQRISLQFANPYAFRGAQMLADYDRLQCAAMTFHHLGIDLPTVLAQPVGASGRWVRRVFALPHGYCHLEVSRLDVRENSERAIRASERMGEIPAGILCGEILPSLRPVPFEARDSGNRA